MADPLDELYAGPLATFVARRKELAAARKEEGDDEGAAEIKRAVKPTMSAWVGNQIAHGQPKVVEALLAATADMVRAQLDAGGGTDERKRYERAVAKQREAEAQLDEAVHAIVSDPSADLVRRVLENFRRGALDAEMRQVLRAGRLSRDVEPQDFGALLQQLGARPARARVAADRKKEEAAKRKAAEEERQKREALARREVERAERQVERLRAELATAEKDLARVRPADDESA